MRSPLNYRQTSPDHGRGPDCLTSAPMGLKTKIEEMEAEVTTLKSELDAAPPPAPILHPNLAKLYRHKVKKLHEALNEPNSRSEAVETLRGIIERIDLALLGRGTFEIHLVGDIVNMIELAETSPQTKTTASHEATVADVYQSSVKVVAGDRCHLYRTWAKR
jgi:site-specific DNA recombinase